MGGGAFGAGADALFTPRMSPDIYRRVRASCHAALRQIFIYVATPIEGPGKKDHGDIDVLVAGERSTIFPSGPGSTEPRPTRHLFDLVKEALKVDYSHIMGPAGNFAIPWPAQDQGSSAANARSEHDKPRHIQVDVRICKDIDDLNWRLFKHAHGDIWNILGSTIRPFGLTLDEDAMWLRIPEIEKIDKKKSKVRLSSDPVEVLHFLGLEVEGYWAEPFPSVEALFEYAATCRFFWVPPESEDGKDDQLIDVGPDGEEAKTKLKSNDRRRMMFRPVFRTWIDEYIPKLRARNHPVRKMGKPLIGDRDTVRDEVFAWFHIEQQYEERLKEWRSKRSSDKTKMLLKEVIPIELESKYRAALLGAMRKIVVQDDESFGITPPTALRDSYGVFDEEAVRRFALDNLDVVGKKAWDIQCERARDAMERKTKAKGSQDVLGDGTSQEGQS